MCDSCRIIRIAICDDEKSVCADLEMKLAAAAMKLNIEVEVESWYSGEQLCDFLSKGNSKDIVFLDIKLTGLSGIGVGHYIRENLGDIKTQIIYISAMQHYALQLFNTQPFDFLIKPIAEETLYEIMNKIQKLIVSHNRFFEYRIEREKCLVKYEDILYFKSDVRKIIIVLMDKEIEFYGKLNDIIKKVPPQFLPIHKSYLINRNYVHRASFETVEMMNKHILTISKPYQKDIRQKMMQPDEAYNNLRGGTEK
jgi:DNA-binding LytR/AlgR family response regulator